MSDLHAMIARWAQPGNVDWVGVRPERRTEMSACTLVEITQEGLIGDHGRPGKRAVTLIQAEHLAAVGSYLGRGAVAPADVRRNIVVSGINLAGLKGRDVQVGQAILNVTTICAPCSRMEETFGPGGYGAVRGHGGWCARVVRAGVVGLGDVVRPLD